MWTRSELKSNAKLSLSNGRYWLALAICIVSGILCGWVNSSGTSASTSSFRKTYQTSPYSRFNAEALESILITILPVMLIGVIIVLVFGTIYGIFVSSPVIVGKNYFFLANREQSAPFTSLFSSFRSERYINIVKTMFLMNLYKSLWSLLFIIPGIIKHYQYYMVPYILADNPGMESSRAFEISKYMTSGDKFNIFILELSFIGWYFIGFLLCCIGSVFVAPYQQATLTELYVMKRQEALDTGFVHPSELGGYPL